MPCVICVYFQPCSKVNVDLATSPRGYTHRIMRRVGPPGRAEMSTPRLAHGALGMDIYVSQLGNKLVISGQVLHGATQMDLRGYGSYTTMCEMCVNVGY